MSHTCLCSDCGARIEIENAVQLHYHNGPRFDHWRQRIAASVGAIIPERLDATSEER